MDTLLPSEYYSEFCEGIGVDQHETVISVFETIDEAITLLLTTSGNSSTEILLQSQLLKLYFGADTVDAVRRAAYNCLCLAIRCQVTDEDIDSIGATIRATMPFLFAFVLESSEVTDGGIRNLSSYLFESLDDEPDDIVPEIAHFDLSRCASLTGATGKYFVDVLSQEDRRTGLTLSSLALSRGAMDGCFDIFTNWSKLQKERRDAIFNERLQSIIRLMNSSDGGGDVAEVSFHTIDMQTVPVPTRRATVNVRNEQHDEVWYPDDDDDVPGSGSSPDPAISGQQLDHSDKRKDKKERTVYHSTQLPPDALLDLFALIDDYQPKIIELKPRFLFPGPLSYVPAVHCPDPMLVPMPPGPIRARAASSSQEPSTNSAAVAGSEGSTEPGAASSSSMFNNFFRSAQQSRLNSPRTPRAATSYVHPTAPFGLILPEAPLSARGGTPRGLAPAPPPPPTVDAARPNPRRLGAHGSTTAAIPAAPTLLSPIEQTSTAVGAGTRPVVPPLALGRTEADRPRAYTYVDPLQYTLERVNDAVLGSRARLAARPLQLPRVRTHFLEQEGGLGAAMRDPSWNPYVPTRAAVIEESLERMKLNYNVVKKERRKDDAPTWVNAREYVAELIIRPTKAETLSSGSMNDAGTILATTHYDMTCKLWWAETGALLHTLSGHTSHLSDCTWNTPYCDKIITSSFDKTLKVWDAASGAELHTLSGHELEVVCVAVSPDGRLCASGGMDDLAVIWDVERGVGLFNLLGHEGEVIAIDFSPCGERLVTGSMDETVRMWSVREGVLIRKFEGHTAEVNQVKFNCFGNMILSGSIDMTCRLWDAETGQSKVLRGHTHEVVDCDFSPDGWTCASASDDTTIRIWDVLTGGCTMLLVGHEQGVCRLLYTPDGSSIVSGSLDSTAKVWNVATGACRQTLKGHKGLVITTYNAASNRIITMSRDNTCRLWRLEEPQNTLAGMAALTIAQNPSTYQAVEAQQALPPTLAQLIRGFFKKFNKDEREKLGELSTTGHRPCNTAPHIPSVAEVEQGTEEEPEGEGGEETTRVVNLRNTPRMIDISPQSAVRVE